MNQSKKIKTETVFSPIFKNQELILNYIIKNISFFVILISIIGGINQAIKLLLMSPSFIIFYSAKQGLIEGALFLIFVLLSYFLFYFYFIEIFRTFTSRLKYKKYLIALWFVVLMTWGIYGAITNKEYIITFIFIPFLLNFILLLAEFNRELITEELDYEPKKEINLSLVEDIRPLVIFLLVLLLLFYSSFFNWYTKNKEKDIFFIENFVDKENDLKKIYNENYILIYSNSEYLFYKNLKNNSYRVIKIENALN
ncbi:MAG TPA: hypothetical protein DIS75_09770 [Chryseobacterium sp.]|nr:hypothetical protein [Chryseobacterium sp.]